MRISELPPLSSDTTSENLQIFMGLLDYFAHDELHNNRHPLRYFASFLNLLLTKEHRLHCARTEVEVPV